MLYLFVAYFGLQLGKYLLEYLTFCSAHPGGCSQRAKSGRCPGLWRIRGLVCIKKLQRNPADFFNLLSYWKPWHTSMVFFHHTQHLPKRRGMAVAGKRLCAPRPGADRSLVLDFPLQAFWASGKAPDIQEGCEGSLAEPKLTKKPVLLAAGGCVGFCTAHPAPPLLNSPGSKCDFVSG